MSLPARRAAVLGSPIAHSLSPVLHRAAYQRLGLTGWEYQAFEVGETGLAGFLADLGPEWAGLSLTMPLKRVAAELAGVVEPVAAAVDAVNTLVRVDGGWSGANTDVPGLVNALAERGVPRVESATILGGGATAASALAAVTEVCTGPVTAYVRTPARADQLRATADRLGHGDRLRVEPWELAAAGLGAGLVVATTPKGAADALADQVPDQPGALFDVVYDPWPTPLARAWQTGCGAVLGGLDLLVHQAVLQVELMTGLPGPLAEMRAAGQRALAGRSGGLSPKVGRFRPFS